MNDHILYIEDNEDNRKLVNKILKAKGYNVLLAKNGIEGWEMIQCYQPKLVLLDISLPGEIDGLEVASKSKKLYYPDQPWIIAVTASAMVGDREHFLKHGCDDYMSKPISLKILLDKIEEVFANVK